MIKVKSCQFQQKYTLFLLTWLRLLITFSQPTNFNIKETDSQWAKSVEEGVLTSKKLIHNGLNQSRREFYILWVIHISIDKVQGSFFNWVGFFHTDHIIGI